MAVAAYLDSAKVIQKTASPWPRYWKRVERAGFLALTIGDPSRKAVLDFLCLAVDGELAAGMPSFYSARLLGLLLQFKDVDSARFAAAAEAQAKIAETAKHRDKAEVYWDLAAKWHARQKDSGAAREARKRAAEAKVQEAEDTTSRSYGAAAALMAEAIEMFRRIGGERPRTETLQRQMLDYQQRALKELGTYLIPIDVQPMVTQAVSAVTGKSLKEAICQLSLICISPTVESLRRQVEINSSESMSSLLASSVLDYQGKVIGKRASLRGASTPDEDAMSCQMHSEATQYRMLAVAGFIDPARHAILKEHRPSQNELEFLVRNNPFVPPGREYAFLRGVSAGLDGDFIVAVHLLIPQVENSIRVLMSQSGVLTSTVDSDGLQEDRNLNSLLYEDDAKKLLDEDLLFDLRGLLIHRFGSNLRNRMAHGLLFDGDCYAPPGRYLWWLVLRFLCTPLIQVNFANIRASSDTPDAGSQFSEGESIDPPADAADEN